MPSMWNKTLFYLGLVDEEEQGPATVDSPVGDVRAVAPAGGDAVPPMQLRNDGQSPVKVAPLGAGIAGRRIEPPTATKQRMSDDRVHAEAGVYVYPGTDAAAPMSPGRRMEPETRIIVARNFADAQALADTVREGRGVVLDLRDTEPEMVRRIVDFASGIIYALDGKMVKTSQGVILVTPTGAVLGIEERERLAALGLFSSQG